jgi:hypothetical protein
LDPKRSNAATLGPVRPPAVQPSRQGFSISKVHGWSVSSRQALHYDDDEPSSRILDIQLTNLEPLTSHQPKKALTLLGRQYMIK